MASPLTPELKEKNFRNMVEFYQDELRQIISGRSVSEFFNEDQKRALRYLNILGSRIPKFKRKNWKGKTQINTVSPEAQALLSYREKIEKG